MSVAGDPSPPAPGSGVGTGCPPPGTDPTGTEPTGTDPDTGATTAAGSPAVPAPARVPGQGRTRVPGPVAPTRDETPTRSALPGAGPEPDNAAAPADPHVVTLYRWLPLGDHVRRRGAALWSRIAPTSPGWAPWALAAVFLLAYTALALLRYRRMGFQSPDVTVFEQALRNYAHLRAPGVDIKSPGFHHLGDHFHPLVALLAPAYRLFPGPGVLLVQQSALFALSVVPVTRTAVGRLGTASGLAVGTAYGMSWGLQNAVNFDFHEICLAVPILAFSLEAVLAGRLRAGALWALLLLGVKEDLGVTVAVLGVLLALRGARRLGTAVCAAGIGGALLVVFVVIPHFHPDHVYPYLDQGGGARTTPWDLAWQMVDDRTKVITLLLLGLVTAFLAVRSPLVALAVPTIVWRFHSPNPTYWGREWHYDAILMPILFLALLDALTRMQHSPREWVRGFARQAPAVVLTVAVVLTSHFPFRDFASPTTYQERDRQPAAERALAAVPDDAVVASDQALLPYLATRARRLFVAGNTGDVRPDYLVVDVREWTQVPDALAWGNSLYPGVGYERVFAEDGYEVLRRVPG